MLTALQGGSLALVAPRREHRRSLLHYNIRLSRAGSAQYRQSGLQVKPDLFGAANAAVDDPGPAGGSSPEHIIRRENRRTHNLASHAEISSFLAEVERRAFKQAMFAVRDEDTALDVVQDAMLKLTEHYAGKPAAELPMLFQRILQNAIRDHFRRLKVRSLWMTLLSALGQKEERDEEHDPLETLPARSDSNATADPAELAEQAQMIAVIEQALSRLPARQREAFLLRYWEELDVAETAAAMGCSEGSVKTHCSRAVHALADMLKARGVTP